MAGGFVDSGAVFIVGVLYLTDAPKKRPVWQFAIVAIERLPNGPKVLPFA